MQRLIFFAHQIDKLSDFFGVVAKWAVFLSCFISAGNAVIRYLFDYSSNSWLEIQWYMFAACVMLGSAQVLRVNEHVRVDVFYGRLSSRTKVKIDIFGLLFFLIPVMFLMFYLSFPLFLKMFLSGEMSNSAGGLIRWPAMLMLPLGFAILILQALAEIIKRVAWLNNRYQMDIHYERPLQ
ncbi:MAG: TRAP transporter small permease subunit [Betaproteobacteria bacterium]|jgi:TRAP-type mannitol/chloroaromatic compound transport system permease small subunit